MAKYMSAYACARCRTRYVVLSGHDAQRSGPTRVTPRLGVGAVGVCTAAACPPTRSPAELPDGYPGYLCSTFTRVRLSSAALGALLSVHRLGGHEALVDAGYRPMPWGKP